MTAPVKIEDRAVRGLKNDPSVWISEGESRFATNWKNRQIKWSVLLARLKNATMTQETVAEYKAMSKTKQDGIKDVGGFVGGTIRDGKRKADTIISRSIITLDLDNAPTTLYEDMSLDAPYAWAIYSTHKHTPEKPRLRVIIPLDRDVTPDEYEAISRKLAEQVGMDYMDATTFQPSRLMYWPSYSRDAQYVFEYNDDPIIKADEVLAQYPDWTDVSFWPLCKEEPRVNKKRGARQQDPLTKNNQVGVFCRTYDVPAAINAFLSDVYTPTDGKSDRYTYIDGSTSGGLVIYDEGRFCYSNHGTDPAHGMDLNAFDLVRVHKFGALDDDLDKDVQSDRRPSYKAMCEFVANDSACIDTYDAERSAEALEDFDDADEAPANWKNKLTRKGKTTEIEASLENLKKIFAYDEVLRGIRLNELSGMVEYSDTLPWRDKSGEWDDSDDSNLLSYLSDGYTEFKRADIADIRTVFATKRRYNPLQDYLRGLPEWDGVERADELFINYLGVGDNAYTREATHKWLLAAVIRAMDPGHKFDSMIVVSGPGGIGKSTLADRLGGDWFSDSLTIEDMRDKTGAEKVLGVWIAEISELKGMRKVDVESIKSFLSRREDKFRKSYGRHVKSYPRTCVFIGTSNDTEYLRDTTGNRRFWPMRAENEKKESAWKMSKETIDQIWSEVWVWYDIYGERELVLSDAVEELAEKAKRDAMESDERSGLIDRFIHTPIPEDWNTKDLADRRMHLDYAEQDDDFERETITVMEIWAECFHQDPAKKQKRDSDDIARMLRNLGWEREGTIRTGAYGTQKAYRKKCKPEA